MPISFTCNQCGKGYLVSDGLAGKRAMCKACNHRMVIPGVATTTTVTQARPASVPASRTAAERTAPAPRAVAVPVARTVARPRKSAREIYGLDETPAALPPLLPRTAGAELSVSEAPPKKKKKKKGFFGSGRKKATSSRRFEFNGLGGGFRLIWILIAAASAAIGGFTFMSKSDMEDVLKRLIAQADQASTTLESIHDLSSGHARSEKARSEFQAIIDTLEKHKGRKGRKADIEALKDRYTAQMQSAFHRLGVATGQAMRVGGAEVASKIQPMMTRLLALLDQLGQDG